MNAQIIEKDGRPEWVVIPYEEYARMLEDLEMQEDLRDFRERTARVASGEDETYPAEVALALARGHDAIRSLREYRGMTQPQLASKAGISAPYLSQLESGRRRGSAKVLAAIATALNVELEMLVAL